jgi:hypothetical protein
MHLSDGKGNNRYQFNLILTIGSTPMHLEIVPELDYVYMLVLRPRYRNPVTSPSVVEISTVVQLQFV